MCVGRGRGVGEGVGREGMLVGGDSTMLFVLCAWGASEVCGIICVCVLP